MWLIVALIFLLFFGGCAGGQQLFTGGAEDDIRINFLMTKQARHPRAFFDQKYYILGHVVNPSDEFLRGLPTDAVEVRDLGKLAEDAVVRMAPIAVWGRPAIERKWEIIADAARAHSTKLILFVGPSVEFCEDYIASFNLGTGIRCMREDNGLTAEELRYYRRAGYDLCTTPPIDKVITNYQWRLARKKKYNDAGVPTRHIPSVVWVANPSGHERITFGKHVSVVNVDELVDTAILEGRSEAINVLVRGAIDAASEAAQVIVCMGRYPPAFGLADYMFCVRPKALAVIPGRVVESNPIYLSRHLAAQGYVLKTVQDIKDFVKKLKTHKH
jgi:hypothetical protein